MISKKTQLTSADIHILTKELNIELDSARIEKIYQIGERILKIRAHITNKGSKDLIIAPNFVCITHYTYKAPEAPSSFAMQLRKHLSGAFLRKISQHNFDRILEFEIWPRQSLGHMSERLKPLSHIEAKELRFLLIAEFFSNGNVILCDCNRKIIGLLEWQKWKDRKLGVGQTYEYPPATEDPMILDYTRFKEILKCDKKLVVSLASDVGINRFYAEELCLLSGFDKERKSSDLNENEIEILFSHFKKIREMIMNERPKPAIVLNENDNPIDVIPFDLEIYKNLRKKEFCSFNDAIDEYFSRAESEKFEEDAGRKFSAKLEKLQKIEMQQRETIKRLEEKSEEFKRIGDLIYQNTSGIEEIMVLIKKERDSGKSWNEIKKNLLSLEISGIKVKDIDEGKGLLILED